jgi:hypothetical protein
MSLRRYSEGSFAPMVGRFDRVSPGSAPSRPLSLASAMPRAPSGLPSSWIFVSEASFAVALASPAAAAACSARSSLLCAGRFG